MLHVVVLTRPVLVPDEVTDETTHHESVATQLLQEVAVRLEDLVWDHDRIGALRLGMELSGLAVEGGSLGVQGLVLAV